MEQHGPLFVVGAVLIIAGIQMLAIGLLGELQVRHYHTSQQRTPYAVDRLVRLDFSRRAKSVIGQRLTQRRGLETRDQGLENMETEMNPA